MNIKIYSKLLNERDIILNSENPNKEKISILCQLGNIAFLNNDHLPKKFIIENVWISEDDFKDLMSNLGIKVNIQLSLKDANAKKMIYRIKKV